MQGIRTPPFLYGEFFRPATSGDGKPPHRRWSGNPLQPVIEVLGVGLNRHQFPMSAMTFILEALHAHGGPSLSAEAREWLPRSARDVKDVLGHTQAAPSCRACSRTFPDT